VRVSGFSRARCDEEVKTSEGAPSLEVTSAV
jgi:hypothetical protein